MESDHIALRPKIWFLTRAASIPEIEVADMQGFEVVRLKESEESDIAVLAEASAKARAAADVMERQIATDAGVIINRFMAGKFDNKEAD